MKSERTPLVVKRYSGAREVKFSKVKGKEN